MEGIIHFLSTNRELFCEDVWNDADMGEVFMYMVSKRDQWPLDVDRLVSMVPMEQFDFQPVA